MRVIQGDKSEETEGMGREGGGAACNPSDVRWRDRGDHGPNAAETG